MNAPQVILPYYNGARYLRTLLETLPPDLDVLIVDDQSPEPLPWIERPRTAIAHMAVRGYWAGACSYGASLCPGRDLLFLNQDVRFTGPGWQNTLANLVDSGVAITGNWVRGHPAWPKGYVDGVFMYVRRDAWDAVGGMDAVNYPMWGSSCLLQTMACRLGYRAAPFPELSRWLVHEREGNLGESFRELLQEEVGHLKNDGNIFRRVPPCVTVVLCAHGDYEQYLPDALESIYRQSRPDWQITISLDGTASPELRALALDAADPWCGVRYVQQPDGRQGPPAVRNAGVKASPTRRFILMLDGDDTAEPDALRLMVPLAKQNPHSFVYGDLRWVGDREGVRVFPEYDYEKLLQANFIPSFILYPRQMWEELGGYYPEFERGWDDYSFAVGAGRAGWCGVHLHEVVLNYRRHGRSRNHDSQERREELRGLLRARFPDVFERRFPPMCCGHGSSGSGRAAPARVAKARNVSPPKGVGAAGMVEVRYLGTLGASFSARGPVTGVRYRVQRGWVGWMDARDARALIGDGQTSGISKDYEYTGRVGGKNPTPVPAPVPVAVVMEKDPPAVVVETPAPVEVPMEPASQPAEANPPAAEFQCACGRAFRTSQGLTMHQRLCKAVAQ